MKKERVLIISTHPLFAEAVTHVLQGEGIAVEATVESLEAALPLLKAHQLGTIIMVCDQTRLSDSEVASMLTSTNEDCRIIFLTLVDNQMIVHYRQRLGNATPADLISVLREPPLRLPE